MSGYGDWFMPQERRVVVLPEPKVRKPKPRKPRPLKPAKYTSEDLIKLFLAAARKQPGVPTSAMSRNGELRYNKKGLYKNNSLVLRQIITPKGRYVHAGVGCNSTIGRRGWGSGRSIKRLAELAVTKDNGPVIEVNGDMGKRPTFANVSEHAGYGHDYITNAVYLCKIYGFNSKRLLPSKPPVVNSYYETRMPHNVRAIVEANTPEALAKQRAFGRRASVEYDRTRRHQLNMTWLNNNYRAASNALDQFTHGQPSAIDVLKFYGHVPKDGELFKVARLDAQGNISVPRGPWAPVGQWTPREENARICYRGWHLCPAESIYDWASHGNHVWLAEGKDEVGRARDKVCFKEARLVKYIGKIDDESLRKIRLSMAHSSNIVELEATLAQATLEMNMGDQGYGY